jgi:hypothetical protein
MLNAGLITILKINHGATSLTLVVLHSI